MSTYCVDFEHTVVLYIQTSRKYFTINCTLQPTGKEASEATLAPKLNATNIFHKMIKWMAKMCQKRRKYS